MHYAAVAGFFLVAAIAAAWFLRSTGGGAADRLLDSWLYSPCAPTPIAKSSMPGRTSWGPLFQAVNELTRRLAAHHRELLQAMTTATARVEEQKSRWKPS